MGLFRRAGQHIRAGQCSCLARNHTRSANGTSDLPASRCAGARWGRGDGRGSVALHAGELGVPQQTT